MKLRPTRDFLADWLAGGRGIPRLGHYGDQPRVDATALHRRHLRKRGKVPKDVFVRKRKFALGRPHVRPAQRYKDFSPGFCPFDNAAVADKVFGNRADFAAGAEYVALIGLRGDEQARVQRVWMRNQGNAPGYEGEHVYMPLADLGVTADQVNDFWLPGRQPWTLHLPTELPGRRPGDPPRPVSLSNCVFCFLKGGPHLRGVREFMTQTAGRELEGFGKLEMTPSDLRWWHAIEERYARNLQEEHRKSINPAVTHLGFRGSRGLLFKDRAFQNAGLPCDCTD